MFSADIKGYLPINKFLPNAFSNIIFYYNYADVKGNIYFNIVNDIEIDYFTSCLPHIFNKNKFKKILPILTNEFKENYVLENKTFFQINGSNYDQIVNFVNNNSLGVSPWENDLMPILSDYFKKLRG